MYVKGQGWGNKKEYPPDIGKTHKKVHQLFINTSEKHHP
jgi:hypothetical protein